MEEAVQPARSPRKRASASASPSQHAHCGIWLIWAQVTRCSQAPRRWSASDNEVGLAEVHRFAEQLEQLAQRHPLPAPSVGAQAVVDASAAPNESPPDDLRSDDIGEPTFAGASEAPDSVRVSIEKLAALIRTPTTCDDCEASLSVTRVRSRPCCADSKLLRTNAKNGDRDLKRTDEEIQHVVRGLRAMRRDLLDDIEGLQSTTGELDDGCGLIELLARRLALAAAPSRHS